MPVWLPRSAEYRAVPATSLTFVPAKQVHNLLAYERQAKAHNGIVAVRWAQRPSDPEATQVTDVTRPAVAQQLTALHRHCLRRGLATPATAASARGRDATSHPSPRGLAAPRSADSRRE